MEIAKKIMGKKDQAIEENLRNWVLLTKKKLILENYFLSGIKDFKYLSDITKLSQQNIRNMWVKFTSHKSIFEDYRNKEKKKLNQTQCQFILDYFASSDNFDKTILDLHSELISQFSLDKSYISFWTLYDYVHSLSMSYKKIVYKVHLANSPQNKLKRKQVARDICGAHWASFDFIYIDEISFNIELRPEKGWSLIGKKLNSTKPVKSKNYSAIVAMDINGILGLKVVKGGIKGAEFISFMLDLCSSEKKRMKRRKYYSF